MEDKITTPIPLREERMWRLKNGLTIQNISERWWYRLLMVIYGLVISLVIGIVSFNFDTVTVEVGIAWLVGLYLTREIFYFVVFGYKGHLLVVLFGKN